MRRKRKAIGRECECVKGKNKRLRLKQQNRNFYLGKGEEVRSF